MNTAFFSSAGLTGIFSTLERLVELVPPQHAAYRPLVLDALLYFLSALPEKRQKVIFAEQSTLPANTLLARRLVALFRLCPTLHKLGQVVARDQRLAPELRQHLQTLESLPPALVDPGLMALIRQQTQDVDGLVVGSQTLAEASVAQIIPFVWKKAPKDLPQEGVFKVLRPGVAERLAEELPIWGQLGSYLEERSSIYGLPLFDFRNTLDSVARLLANEIRLDQEQSNLLLAKKMYADCPEVLIPALYPFCTPNITAMQRVFGSKITEVPATPSNLRRRAHLVAEAMLAIPFWESGHFHADPHAGNLMLTEDNRLALLDWALMMQLKKPQCEALMQIVLGALSLNTQKICCAVTELGQVRDPIALQTIVSESLPPLRQGRFPGFDWLSELLDRLSLQSVVRFPEELILFRKAVLTLNGVVADISGAASIDSVLISSGAVDFFHHLTTRLVTQAQSRHTGIHVSNRDLLDLWLGSPITIFRFWFGLPKPGQHSSEPTLRRNNGRNP